MVMVIYLHEALDKKLVGRGDGCTEQDIYDATFEGAVLRLRPKLMTVAVALMGLIPIMWSTQHRGRRNEADRSSHDRRYDFIFNTCAHNDACDIRAYEDPGPEKGEAETLGDEVLIPCRVLVYQGR